MKKFLLLIQLLFSINTFSFSQEFGSIKDPGNEKIYTTVRIGSQQWCADNLNTDRFQNGDLIPEAKTSEEWRKAGQNHQPVWCYYENITNNGIKYGKIYNWYAINDKRNLAPKGFHIASGDEWDILIDYLGGISAAGAKLRSTSGWTEQGGVNGLNSSGFNATPGGEREEDGEFNFIGSQGVWWTSTRDANRSNWFIMISSKNYELYWKSSDFLNEGYYVRCIKD